MDIKRVVISSDSTKKYYFVVSDNTDSEIEACLLYLPRYGYIICVSSQLGCSQRCHFCAAGKRKFVRNLESLEIQEQVRLIVEDNPALLTEKFQVTYMGSGEPLSNYRNVFDSIDSIREKYDNLCKVNISTTCPTIGRNCFTDTDWGKYHDFLHFQYSLHFTTDDARQKFLCKKLMKIEESIDNLNRVAELINDIYKINYILFDKLNDNEACIEELKKVMSSAPNAILKLSQMCEINECDLLPSKHFDDFVACVMKELKKVEVFRSDGTDVNAGCGQFYNESVI